MAKTLIFGEQREGVLHPAVFQLVTAARELDSSADLSVCVIGKDVGAIAEKIGRCGVAEVLTADDAKLKLYRPQPYARMLQAAIEKVQPTLVLMPATFMGRDLAPRVAVKTNAAVATDCIGVALDGGSLVASRPAYSGKATAQVKLSADRLNIVSIRPNTYSAADEDGTPASIEEMPVNLSDDEQKLVTRELASTTSGIKDVTEADIVVSGGRSLKSEEGFKILFSLAEVLDAAVGASRAACDAGYQPHSRQVGLTGKTVTPKLYMAFGIDGAIQHLAGMRGSKCIVAINTKKEAPIFSVSDYGCVADLFVMAPLLTEELKKVVSR